METQQTSQENKHVVLLDISLFVLDMLSPEKIKENYGKRNDGIVLEVPSAFITMIADAQAGNSLLMQFIGANLEAVRNNPIHKESQESQIQELVNATDARLKAVKENVHRTILQDFAPLMKDISKIDQIIEQSKNTSSADYPIQVYEPLIPVSTDELRALRMAYFQELNLIPHPLFDLYFLQIYHAQTAGLVGETPFERKLLSVGKATYKTIKVWKLALFGKPLSDYDIVHDRNNEFPAKDASRNLIQTLVVNYFRNKWIPIITATTSILVDVVLTIPQTGRIGFGDFGLAAVGFYSADLIVKGIVEKDRPIVERASFIFVGALLIACVFFVYLIPRAFWSLFDSSLESADSPVLPKIIITTTESVTPSLNSEPEQEFLLTATSMVAETETPTIVTVEAQLVNETPTPNYCMYVAQPGDNVQSLAARFNVSEVNVRSQNGQVALKSFVTNQMIRVNASCCSPIGGRGFSYTVQARDNLYSLSNKYSTTINAIASANNLHAPWYIQTGQMLCIPYP